MDKSIVPVEESYKRNDLGAPASKSSLGSLVHINSIAIDITCAMEETDQSPAHEHFSIRGFVAGMRRKDLKTCVPSGFNADADGAVDSLPPLSVPRFRWWQCSNCVPDIAGAKTTIPEMPFIDRSVAGTSSCQNVDGEKDGMLSNTKPRAGSKERTDVRDNEGRNISCYCNTEAVPLQIVEGHHSGAVDEPENASSGSDDAFSVLPHRRKPKLRSLADIMEEDKNSTSELSRMRSTSTEAGTDNLDVPIDMGKGTRSPPRKKKIIEEDRGYVEPSFPIGAAKTSRRVENSDSESGGADVPTRVDLRHNIKTHQVKAKKNKSLDTTRKTRQAHIDNRAIPVNAVRSLDLQKHTTMAETSARNKGNAVPSTLGAEMEAHLLSGKQMARISTQSKGKRPEVEPDSIPSSKSKLENRNVQREVALDLSLNSYVAATAMATERNSNNQIAFRHHSGIPDLNESFTEKLSQGKQLPALPEKQSLSLQRTLEMSTSCNKETAREGKRKSGVSQLHSVQNMVSNVETGRAIDDIPMEIVELMAKNQHDRALGNSRQQLPSEGFNNSVRVSSPSVYMDARTGVVNFPFHNAGSSAGIARGKIGVTQGILHFPQAKNRQLDMGNPEDFRLFSSFTPSETKKTQYSASNSFLSGPRHNDGADLLWPPRRKNQPFIPNATKSCSVQPNALNVHPFSDNCYKGKTIGSMKGDENRTIRDVAAVKEGRIGFGHNSVGSLDAYSNDTIPAMQLLSLMDRGIVSGSSSKVGFLDKNLSPCNNHPRLYQNENQTNPFVSAPFFSQNSRAKEFPGLLNGICFPGERLKKPYYQGQVPSEPSNSKAVMLETSPCNANRSSGGNIQPLGVCKLNRNPADFSFPDAKNEFTITAKDLKFKKRNALKERSRIVNADDQKRQRVRKDAIRRES